MPKWQRQTPQPIPLHISSTRIVGEEMVGVAPVPDTGMTSTTTLMLMMTIGFIHAHAPAIGIALTLVTVLTLLNIICLFLALRTLLPWEDIKGNQLVPMDLTVEGCRYLALEILILLELRIIPMAGCTWEWAQHMAQHMKGLRCPWG